MSAGLRRLDRRRGGRRAVAEARRLGRMRAGGRAFREAGGQAEAATGGARNLQRLRGLAGEEDSARLFKCEASLPTG